MNPLTFIIMLYWQFAFIEAVTFDIPPPPIPEDWVRIEDLEEKVKWIGPRDDGSFIIDRRK